MGYEVRLTAKARGDLNEIVAYIAQDNPLAAERLGDELAAEADSLSNYPYRGGLVRRRRNIRRLVHGSYLIVYRIFESNHLIEILRFTHSGIDSHLAGWHGARAGGPFSDRARFSRKAFGSVE
jgi:toxin ParE1/3/4